MAKKWYKSRTFWVNLMAISSLILDAHYGFQLTGAEAGAVLVVVNLVMRGVTSEPLES